MRPAIAGNGIGGLGYLLRELFGVHQQRALIRQRKSSRCKLILGGPHATFAPHEALEYADYVILGEGEIPSLQLILALETGGSIDQVENLCYQGGDGALVINRFARYGNLDNPIHPALLKRAPRLHWATVSMSRGCPFDCSFCYAIRVLGRLGVGTLVVTNAAGGIRPDFKQGQLILLSDHINFTGRNPVR